MLKTAQRQGELRLWMWQKHLVAAHWSQTSTLQDTGEAPGGHLGSVGRITCRTNLVFCFPLTVPADLPPSSPPMPDTQLSLPTSPGWRADILCEPFAFPADHVYTQPRCGASRRGARSIHCANRRLLAVITVCTRVIFLTVFHTVMCRHSGFKRILYFTLSMIMKTQFLLYIQIITIDLMCLCSIS